MNSMQGQIICLCFTCTLWSMILIQETETSGNFFVDLNRFWITLIPLLSQEYYYKKHRFTVTSSLF